MIRRLRAWFNRPPVRLDAADRSLADLMSLARQGVDL